MDTKLTLRLDSRAIKEAKTYASNYDTSLSKIVEVYFHFLSEKKARDYEISPAIRSLSGIIKLPKKFNYKKERQNYLVKKYLSKK